ncbi:DUF2829 domain-containing protein [Photorhabdus hindustanensis]|uniref:DUF2829 domain-containing protein n=1 Tax=Photorhabdus hindustanensis TaxID=2918802 RepID=A0A2S8Q188_9GAMM|nr:DUF2829 domain-containing protein [Photorhabdus hindustanensis]PQQ25557.1 hypothetical protein C6H66_12235 [Photorhabdus hindustanensis]
MSEVMKPENECPFDPKQYECHSVVAPVGSFSWALIQLKLRKLVSRSVWSDKKMYLAIAPRVNDLTVEEGSAYAVDGVTVGTKYDYLTHIDLRNEHGNFVPWQPTQEDMMACDWELLSSSTAGDMLVFDVASGVFGPPWWGANQSAGKLSIVENHINIRNIDLVQWGENIYVRGDMFSILLVPEIGYEDYLKNILDKKLIIKVDGQEYNLGRRVESDGAYNWIYYEGREATRLGNLLKQPNKTYLFHCNWSD